MRLYTENSFGKIDFFLFSNFFLKFSWEDIQRDRAPSPRVKNFYPECKPDCLFLVFLLFSLLANFMAKDTDIINSDCVYKETKEQK